MVRGASGSASTSVVKGKQNPLGSLQIAGRHFAGLVVAFQVEADLLAFDEFAHTSPLNGGDMNEGIRAAVVRLNEAEAFSGIKPFNCASGHDEPFHSDRGPTALRSAADIDSDFERKGSFRTRCQSRNKQS
ncbi:conserved hypothetical protein [Agrobacterium fabacearum S56]|nr:conserved hypothetical protein [Agrobacterium fabacearum S56]